MIKRILVGGAGGAPSLNFIRSLRKARERFHIIGMSCSEYDLCRAKKLVDKIILVPPARKEHVYIPILQQVISEERPDFLHVQNDEEVFIVSKHRAKLDVRIFLPEHGIVEICQNKFNSAQRWQRAGLKVPKTYLINDENDLKKAFSALGGKVWIRAITGAFGKWSLPSDNFEFAKLWINYHGGWGQFSAAEYLTPESITWLSIWKSGELIVAQSRKRLYWEFANRSISGVTGITGTGVTLRDQRIDKLAQSAIFAIDKKPNGIYGVDLTYDNKGMPNPTEINIGRFFTTHQFFTAAGLNMPYIYVKLAFGEKIPKLKRRINPLPSGLAWVRGMDIDPVLTTVHEIKALENNLSRRLQKIKKST